MYALDSWVIKGIGVKERALKFASGMKRTKETMSATKDKGEKWRRHTDRNGKV